MVWGAKVLSECVLSTGPWSYQELQCLEARGMTKPSRHQVQRNSRALPGLCENVYCVCKKKKMSISAFFSNIYSWDCSPVETSHQDKIAPPCAIHSKHLEPLGYVEGSLREHSPSNPNFPICVFISSVLVISSFPCYLVRVPGKDMPDNKI